MTTAKANDKRVAVVTGASSGIGLGITTTLLERGYRVVEIPDDQQINRSATFRQPDPRGRRYWHKGGVHQGG